MKVARWKVVGLAGVLALGYVADASAVQMKVSDGTWADFGLNMKVWYYNKDKRSNSTLDGGWTQNVFDVGQTRVYFTGQVSPLFQFYTELDTNGASGNTGIEEAGINLAFAKEFQVLVGKIRKPFTRVQLTNDYTYLTPQGYFLDPQGGLGAIKDALKSADAGLMFHGDLADGMFRYRVGVFNEDRNLNNKLWVGGSGFGWVDEIPTFSKINDKKGLEWDVRIEFTPTMLGFKPESAATITSKVADTYLGSRDVLTIGLGYHTEKHSPKITLGDETISGELKRKGWTIDAMFEKKFGALVPNLQIGYISLDKTHYYVDFRKDSVRKGDADIWYMTGQLLYDQYVGFGKPALAFRYERITGDGQWTDGDVVKKDLTAETLGVAFNYYIKGQAARISVGFDQTKYKDALKYVLKKGDPATKYEDSITDWYINFQIQF
jgi:hypothetical protein